MTDRRNKIIFIVGNVIACVVITLLVVWNFYPQSGVVDAYSDSRCHAEWAKAFFEKNPAGYAPKVKAYPLFFYLTGLAGSLVNDIHIGIVIIGVLFALIAFGAIEYYIFRRLSFSVISPIGCILYAFALSFAWPVDFTFSLLRGKMSISELYLKVLCTNPAHSITALAPKGLSILVVMLFCECFAKKQYERKMLIISVLLLGSVLLKPSFYQFFVIAGTVVVIAAFLRRPNISNFEFTLCMALSFIPATAFVINGKSEGGIGFAISPFECILKWNRNLLEAAWSVFMGIFFCILVLVVSLYKKSFSKELGFAWLCYAIGTLEYILLVEPADVESCNFAWGYMGGMFLLFVVSVVEMEKLHDRGVIGKYGINILRGVLLWHAAVGIYAYLKFAEPYRLSM